MKYLYYDREPDFVVPIEETGDTLIQSRVRFLEKYAGIIFNKDRVRYWYKGRYLSKHDGAAVIDVLNHSISVVGKIKIVPSLAVELWSHNDTFYMLHIGDYEIDASSFATWPSDLYLEEKLNESILLCHPIEVVRQLATAIIKYRKDYCE